MAGFMEDRFHQYGDNLVVSRVVSGTLEELAFLRHLFVADLDPASFRVVAGTFSTAGTADDAHLVAHADECVEGFGSLLHQLPTAKERSSVQIRGGRLFVADHEASVRRTPCVRLRPLDFAT
jgi:hypothetical protein